MVRDMRYASQEYERINWVCKWDPKLQRKQEAEPQAIEQDSQEQEAMETAEQEQQAIEVPEDDLEDDIELDLDLFEESQQAEAPPTRKRLKSKTSAQY